MPSSCCAIGCTNRQSGPSGRVGFFRIPSNHERRRQWLSKISRENWSPKKGNARICGAHFITGKPNGYPKHPDYVPTVFAHRGDVSTQKTKGEMKAERCRRAARRCLLIDFEKADNGVMASPLEVEEEAVVSSLMELCDGKNYKFLNKGTNTDMDETYTQTLEQENQRLRGVVQQLYNEIHKLKDEIKKSRFNFNNLKNDSKKLNFFTGIISFATFIFIVSLVKSRVQKVVKCLSFEDHLVIIFMKLKLGLLNKDIAYRFNVSAVTVSRILRRWLPVLSGVMREFIVWPDKLALRQHLPTAFKKNYKNARCIIDCTEIFTERPLNLTARAQTWSNYKHNNTIKYLVAITPAGAVSFMSAGYGGRMSDKEITSQSGFYEKVEHGDDILADRGFLIREELAIQGATLRIPHFTKGKKQLHGAEVDISRQLSRVRIHVERVIGRMKKFRILQTTIPISQIQLIDHFMLVIAGLTNLAKSVVPKK